MNLFGEVTGLTPKQDAALYGGYKAWCLKHSGMLPCWQGFMTWKICQAENGGNNPCVHMPPRGKMATVADNGRAENEK